jgi:ketosteroid isomerase-like protein
LNFVESQREPQHTARAGDVIRPGDRSTLAERMAERDDLLRLNKALGLAEKHKDIAALDHLVAADYLGVDARGQVQTKNDVLLRFASPDLKVTRIETADVTVRVFGDVAIITGRSASRGSFKSQPLGGKFRFIDIWVRRDEHWQIVASQMTSEAESPSSL